MFLIMKILWFIMLCHGLSACSQHGHEGKITIFSNRMRCNTWICCFFMSGFLHLSLRIFRYLEKFCGSFSFKKWHVMSGWVGSSRWDVFGMLSHFLSQPATTRRCGLEFRNQSKNVSQFHGWILDILWMEEILYCTTERMVESLWIVGCLPPIS